MDKFTRNFSHAEKRWQSIADFYQESEDFLRQQELDRKNTELAYQKILTTIDHALMSRDYAPLPALVPYIEKGEGFLAYQYIGKTHRLLRILNIITLEEKFHTVSFCQGCDNADALYEKYIMTLFAFRRLLFRLSPESVDEAVVYLQSHPISHFAAYLIMEGDLLIPGRALCEDLADIYADEWNPADMRQFFSLISTLPTIAPGEVSNE